MYTVFFAIACLVITSGANASIDADKAAELSREIREHFRRTGANWVSPRMFQELNLTRNSKPIMVLSTSRSCADCRDFMESWGKIDKVTVSSITAQFLSVLALDDYIFEMGELAAPDVDYLPRVVFADPDGTVRREIKNKKGDLGAPYYYEDAAQVVTVMREFLSSYWENLGTDVFRGDLTEDIF